MPDSLPVEAPPPGRAVAVEGNGRAHPPQPSANGAAPALAAPRCPRYQSLDFWRGVACLLVVVYHATMVHLIARAEAGASDEGLAAWLLRLTHYMNIGVPLFFVISGYCISAAADTVRQRRHSLGTYFVRRFRRIYPPFWAFLACYAALFVALDYLLLPGLLSGHPLHLLRPWWYSGWQWLGNCTLTETWRHYLIGDGRGHFPGHDWTLCYEEQFYAVTGLLLLLSRRYFFAGAAAVSVVTVGIVVACAATGASVAGWFFDGYWLAFAAGIVAYYRVNYAFGPRGRLLDVLLAAAVVAALFSPLPLPYGSAVAFGFALLLAGIHRWDRLLTTSALAAPVVFCGQMCYSLYLVHQLPARALSMGLRRLGLDSDWATLGVTVPCALVVSVALAWVFHVTVERRFLNAPPGLKRV